MDRNHQVLASAPPVPVALRKESVDRNSFGVLTIQVLHEVALRKESVDRNEVRWRGQRTNPLSLSARRAWIEINIPVEKIIVEVSLSARRAWIEIDGSHHGGIDTKSLSARRAWIEI